jgi:hypothetical protein
LPFKKRAATTPPCCAQPLGEHSFGIAPGMGRKSKVKVLLEPKQTESNTEGRGYPAREVRWKP